MSLIGLRNIDPSFLVLFSQCRDSRTNLLLQVDWAMDFRSQNTKNTIWYKNFENASFLKKSAVMFKHYAAKNLLKCCKIYRAMTPTHLIQNMFHSMYFDQLFIKENNIAFYI